MPKHKSIVMATAAAAVLIAGGAYFLLKSRTAETSESGNIGAPPLDENPTGQDGTTEEYANPDFGFSFRHEKGFDVSESEDENGRVIVFQKPNAGPVKASSDGANKGFQIYISEFDEPGPITAERVKKDVPGMAVEEPQAVILTIHHPEASFDRHPERSEGSLGDSSPSAQNGGGVRALVFFSRDKSFGRTREVWFVAPEDPQPNGNYLYQITAPAEFDEELSKIMATFILDTD